MQTIEPVQTSGGQWHLIKFENAEAVFGGYVDGPFDTKEDAERALCNYFGI